MTAEHAHVVAKAEKRTNGRTGREVFETPVLDGLYFGWVDANSHASFHDYAQIIDLGDVEPRFLDVALEVGFVQPVDDLLAVFPVLGFFSGVDQYVISVGARPVVQQLLELRVDELLPPGWAYLEAERKNFPLERPLASPKCGQIFGSDIHT